MSDNDHVDFLRNMADRLAGLEEEVESLRSELRVRVGDLEFSEKVFTYASAIVAMLVIERIWDRFF